MFGWDTKAQQLLHGPDIIGQASGHGGGYGPPMSERSVATWGPLPSLCVLGMLYTITRYRDTTENRIASVYDILKFHDPGIQ